VPAGIPTISHFAMDPTKEQAFSRLKLSLKKRKKFGFAVANIPEINLSAMAHTRKLQNEAKG
jgi:hypothetical protein